MNDLKVARKYVSLEQSSGRRGIEFNLSLLSLRNVLRAKRCYYTKVVLTTEEGQPNSLTIDRVDNTKGYVTGNIVACSQEFNQRKGGITLEDIELLYHKIIET